MTHFEYKVVPAPAKGRKAKGVRRSEDKFAFAVQEMMNELGRDGWEFWRSETLPHEERTGLTTVNTTYRSVMVFRKPASSESDDVPRIESARQLASLPAPSLIDADTEEVFYDLDELEKSEKDMKVVPNVLRMRANQVRTEHDLAAE